MLLGHLTEIEFEPALMDVPDEGFVPLKKVNGTKMLDAQMSTSDWLKGIGAVSDEDVANEAQQSHARDAFKTLVTTPDQAKSALEKLEVPAAVRQIVGMLSAYDWQFVEQAQQLRGMAVAKIVEETDHPDARIRLKALELLGRVTEVGLFTERIEIKKTDLSNEELDAKIKEKLQALSQAISSHNTYSGETVDGELVETDAESD